MVAAVGGREAVAQHDRPDVGFFTVMSHAMRAVLAALVLGVTLSAAVRQGVGTSVVSGSQGQTNPATASVPATGTAAVSGVVTDATTGRPIAGVIVTLMLRTNAPLTRAFRQVTDALGRFVVRDLPAAMSYTITTSRRGYLDGAYGQTVLLGSNPTLTLTDGQWFSKADVVMWKPGAISGRVLDEHSEPLVGVYVRAMAQLRIAGQLKIIGGPTSRTDDRGEYRIAGLPPGPYLICVPSVQYSVPADAPPSSYTSTTTPSQSAERALIFGFILQPPPRTDAAMDLGDPSTRLLIGNFATPPPAVNGRAQAYPITFFPGVMSPAGATSVEVRIGEEHRGIDVTVQPVPTARISGKVDGPQDGIRGLVLRLLPAGLEELGPGGEAATALVASDGSFTFLSVPAGAYTIDARRFSSELTYPTGSGNSLPSAPGSSLGGASSGSIASGPPGSGLLNRSGGGTDLYWARTTVTVGARDVSNVGVMLHRGVTLSGRIVFEGTTRVTVNPPMVAFGAGSASPGSIRSETTTMPSMPIMYAEPANGDPTLGVLHSDGRPDPDVADSFRIDGLRSGEYVLRVMGAATGAYAMKSITMAGEDYTNRPFDATRERDLTDVVVTFTDKTASLSGVVQDDQGWAPLAAVIVFPAERDQWSRYGFTPLRVRSVSAAGATGYAFNNLPAGSYYLIAVEPSQIAAWQDPAFLEKAAALVSPIVLGWGDMNTINPTIMRVR